MIDSMLQEGTDAALDDQVARPRPAAPNPSSFSVGGVLSAPFKGIGSGTAKSLAFGAELTGAFGQTLGGYGPDSAGGMFSTQSEQEKKQAAAARAKGVDFSNEAGDILRQRAADILPNPQTAHASEQVIAGLTDFATRAVGYSFTLGPLAPIAFGGDVGMEESDRLKKEGVDLATRTKAGAAAGAINAAALVAPMSGPTALIRFGKGAAAGEAAIVGQALAERAIVRAAGYDKIADSFDPFDPVALALGVVPGALGAKFGKPKLRTEADVRKAAQFTPAEQARSDAYERSPTNLAELERAIASEKSPEVKALLQTELAKQQKAAAEHGVSEAVKAEPDLVPAARVSQVVDALEASRLTPDADLPGRQAHLSAVEMAHEQMARGEDVNVEYIVAPKLEEPVRVSEKDGWMTAKVDGGEVSGQIRDGALHISQSELAPERRGAGLGVSMYQSLIDAAHARGLRTFSDVTVSGDATRIYDALGRRGYDVERRAGGGDLLSPDGEVQGAFGPNVAEPAYEVRAKNRGPEHTAAAMEKLRTLREQSGDATPPRATRERPARAAEPDQAVRQIELIEKQRGALQSLLECLGGA